MIECKHDCVFTYIGTRLGQLDVQVQVGLTIPRAAREELIAFYRDLAMDGISRGQHRSFRQGTLTGCLPEMRLLAPEIFERTEDLEEMVMRQVFSIIDERTPKVYQKMYAAYAEAAARERLRVSSDATGFLDSVRSWVAEMYRIVESRSEVNVNGGPE